MGRGFSAASIPGGLAAAREKITSCLDAPRKSDRSAHRQSGCSRAPLRAAGGSRLRTGKVDSCRRLTRPHGTIGQARPKRATPSLFFFARRCAALKTACLNDRFEIDGGLLGAAAAPAANCVSQVGSRRRGILKTSPAAGGRYRFRGLLSTRALKQLRIAATDAYRPAPVHPPIRRAKNVPRAERSSKPPLHRKSQNSPGEATSPLFYLAVFAIERETPEAYPAGLA